MTPTEKLRAKLLDLAIRGKLVAQDPNDEPAEELLRRILAAKNAKGAKDFNAEAQRRRDSKSNAAKSPRRSPVGSQMSLVPPEEQPFALPKGWVWCRLGEICETPPKNGYSPKPVNHLTSVKRLTLTATTAGCFKPDEFKYVDENIPLDSHLWLHPGDLLVQRSNSMEHIGTSCIFTGRAGEYIYPDLMMKVFLSVMVDVRYADYVLKAEQSRRYFQRHAGGSAGSMPKINKEILENLPIPLPPLAEQKRIVGKLETLLKAVDTLGTCAEKFDKLSDKARAKILDLAIRGKLVAQDPNDEPAEELLRRILTAKGSNEDAQRRRDSKSNAAKSPRRSPVGSRMSLVPPEEQPFALPKGWVWCRLGEICSKIGAGSTPLGGKRVYVNKGIKFIREQNVHNAGLCNEGMVFIDENTNQKMVGTIVKPCDLLMNITGASIGRTALVADDFDIGNVNQHVLIIRLIELSVRHFIHLVLCSPHIVQRMLNVQTGDKPGLSAEKVKGFLVPLPPLAEQKRIVEKVEALLAACEKLKGAGA